MAAFLDRLYERKVLVADGAMGTMLFLRGLTPGECPERINLEHPDILEEIARLYVEAGAEIIQTNTFGGSPLKLAMYHLDDKTEEINIAAVRAARNGASAVPLSPPPAAPAPACLNRTAIPIRRKFRSVSRGKYAPLSPRVST
jgi:methionine synthase I (cobalamin-dependent)